MSRGACFPVVWAPAYAVCTDFLNNLFFYGSLEKIFNCDFHKKRQPGTQRTQRTESTVCPSIRSLRFVSVAVSVEDLLLNALRGSDTEFYRPRRVVPLEEESCEPPAIPLVGRPAAGALAPAFVFGLIADGATCDLHHHSPVALPEQVVQWTALPLQAERYSDVLSRQMAYSLMLPLQDERHPVALLKQVVYSYLAKLPL